MSANILNIETVEELHRVPRRKHGEPRREFSTASSLHIFSVERNFSIKKHFLTLNASLIEGLLPLIFMSAIRGHGIKQNNRVNNRVRY